MSSNEPRDQLVADLMAYTWSDRGLRSAHEEHRFDATCAICTANVEAVAGAVTTLGWCPPRRRIETATALRDELDGTVVRFRGGVVASVNTGSGHWPGRVMTLESPVDYWHLSDGDAELFPAVVLWEPEEASGE